MKLLLCAKCHDVRALDLEVVVSCRCGESKGRYLSDRVSAEFSGDDAYLVGFNNRSFATAIRSHIHDGDHYDGLGRRFEAFIIPEGAPSVRRENDV